MKERDHFLSKNMVNIPECGKLHLHLSKFSGGEPPDPQPKYVPPQSQNAADALDHDHHGNKEKGGNHSSVLLFLVKLELI